MINPDRHMGMFHDNYAMLKQKRLEDERKEYEAGMAGRKTTGQILGLAAGALTGGLAGGLGGAVVGGMTGASVPQDNDLGSIGKAGASGYAAASKGTSDADMLKELAAMSKYDVQGPGKQPTSYDEYMNSGYLSKDAPIDPNSFAVDFKHLGRQRLKSRPSNWQDLMIPYLINSGALGDFGNF